MNGVPRNNSAGRLHHILGRAYDQRGNQTIMTMWCNVLEVYPHSVVMLRAKLTEVDSLILQVRRDLAEIKSNIQVDYLSSFGPIEDVFAATNLDSNWDSLRDKLHPDGAAMARLSDSAQYLLRQRPEPSVDSNELQRLKIEVETLIREVMKSHSLDNEFRAFILDQLHVIARAMSSYAINGFDGLRKGFTDVAGALRILNPGIVSEAKGNPDGDHSSNSESEKLLLLRKVSNSVSKLGIIVWKSLKEAGKIGAIFFITGRTPDDFIKEHLPTLNPPAQQQRLENNGGEEKPRADSLPLPDPPVKT